MLVETFGSSTHPHHHPPQPTHNCSTATSKVKSQSSINSQLHPACIGRQQPHGSPSASSQWYYMTPRTGYLFYVSTVIIVILASVSVPSVLQRLASVGRQLLPSTFLYPSQSSAMSSSSYSKELEVALLAVQRASILTAQVFHAKSKGTLTKSDASPVTIGDYGAQALIISALKHNFPADEIVAEEEAEDLRQDAALKDLVWGLVKDTKLDDPASEDTLGGAIPDAESMLKIIDQGNSKGGPSGRFWTIDPIDGTKGYLRGGQYAVCVALIVDGDVKVGVLGCPNLPVDDSTPLDSGLGENQTDSEGKGVLAGAIKGHGAESRPLGTGKLQAPRKISVQNISTPSEAAFCESVEANHSSQGDTAEIARRLGITKPSVRMDSQAKYFSVARGAGDIYLRLPVAGKNYVEKIWDHAAGDLITREAGGVVTDIKGNALDFSKGRLLTDNKGVVAAGSAIHAQVLKTVQDVLGLQ